MHETAVNLELHPVRHVRVNNWDEHMESEVLVSPPPELPANKQHHLIFCYSSTVAREVRSIVRGVETWGLKCCFYERDFINGKTIIKNIEDLMQSAQCVVFILTEDFINSRYFPIEIEHALDLKGQNILHSVIPVRLDSCKIPIQLKPITCVDLSNRSYEEAAHEIYNNFVKLDKELSIGTETVGGEVVVQALQSKRSRFSTLRDVLVLDETFRANLLNNQMRIPDSVLEKAQTLVNKSLLVGDRKAVMDSRPRFVFCISMLVVLFAILIFITPAAMNRKTAFKEVYWPIYLFFLFVVVFATLCCCIDGCCCKITEKLFSRATQNLRKVLWRRINRSLLRDHQAIIMFEESVFLALRLNIQPCKETFQRKIREMPSFYNFDEQRETEEDFCNRMFDGWLAEHYHELKQSNRTRGSVHRMANYALCPCTQVLDYAMTNERYISS